MAEAPGPLSVTGLARDLRISKSMVHGLLVTMAEQGFVERLPDRTYQLGIGVLIAGESVRRRRDVRTTALPVMRDLCRETGDPVYLFVVHGDSGVLLERVVPNMGASVTMEIGEQGPLHVGSLRKVLLAYQPEEALCHYLGRSLERVTAFSPTDPTKLREQLAEVRVQGYAYTEQESFEGIAGLAAPVFDATGTVVASIGVSTVVPRMRARRDAVASSVRDAAARVSAALGHLDRRG